MNKKLFNGTQKCQSQHQQGQSEAAVSGKWQPYTREYRPLFAHQIVQHSNFKQSRPVLIQKALVHTSRAAMTDRRWRRMIQLG